VPLIRETGQLDWPALEQALRPDTRLIAIGAASNALGTITDVARAARLARAAGALTFVDAVHFAPHERVDVGALDCDFLACSAYKFYGPHIGIMFARENVLRGLDVPKLQPAPDTPPERLETGTLNHEGIVGAAAAVEFLASLAPGHSRTVRLARVYAELHDRGLALTKRLWNGLRAIDGVTVYGPPPPLPRTPTIAFTMAGMEADGVAERLAARAVFVSSGDFYATTVVERLELSGGLVRAGCACYTTEEEIDRLIEAVRTL
jgi:selenocysteine lyase/cysteine desulfurase